MDNSNVEAYADRVERVRDRMAELLGLERSIFDRGWLLRVAAHAARVEAASMAAHGDRPEAALSFDDALLVLAAMVVTGKDLGGLAALTPQEELTLDVTMGLLRSGRVRLFKTPRSDERIRVGLN